MLTSSWMDVVCGKSSWILAEVSVHSQYHRRQLGPLTLWWAPRFCTLLGWAFLLNMRLSEALMPPSRLCDSGSLGAIGIILPIEGDCAGVVRSVNLEM